MANIEKLEQSLDQMIQLMVTMKKSLSEDVKDAEPPQKDVEKPEDMNTFEQLKSALDSDEWPAAVNKNLICDPNSEEDKTERGRGIIELMIEEDLDGLKFLDYGCGEGHCAYLSSEYKTTKSVGYDIKKHDEWDNFDEKDNLVITDDIEKVKENGPYDVVTLFDVIDHTATDPVEVLSEVKSLLSENGKIYLRCHPNTSRHATHLYHDLNKAFVHLVFTPEELKSIIPESAFEQKNYGVKYPLMTYGKYIEESGLKEVNRRDVKENVEQFFKIPKISERILKNLGGFDAFPEFQMSMGFIDYILKK